MPIPPFRQDGWLPVGHHASSWGEVLSYFGGQPNSRRARLTAELIGLRDALLAVGITGTILLDGSYISEKQEPADFDILLIGPDDIQIRKDLEPNLGDLLDVGIAEARGYSLLYTAENSPARDLLSTLWDFTRGGTAKGIVKLTL